jgi:hypothetical protein
MKFQVTLLEGDQLVGQMDLPGIRIGPGARPQPEAAGKAVAEALIPHIAAQIETQLPPASPVRREVIRENGLITGAIGYPATPPPAFRANRIAKQLAATLALEYTAAVAREYERIDAAARATAQATARAQASADLARKIEAAAKRTLKGLQGPPSEAWSNNPPHSQRRYPE